MYAYIFGLAFMFHGAMFLKKGLQSFDPPHLHFIMGVGNLFSLIYFIAGFFIYPWYFPVLGFLVVPLLLSFANFKFFRHNLFFALKDQLAILLGFILCTYGIIVEIIN